ncbi:hypothetical protein [Christensenella massiliensis]|uniref:Uncharacterized protein n=1 Tax=Christensenella massiliensis TaxID=1805714 RepID=A0AAU8A6G6_9FIRM
MEKCPKCGTDLRLESGGVVVEGSDAFLLQRQYCVNPQCENYAGKRVTEDSRTVAELRHKLT